MDEPVFSNAFTAPEHEVSQVVFYPDRVYHARRLAAARCLRYRYRVEAVRTKADVRVLTGAVFLDGVFLSNFMRIEYRSNRLAELARERGRRVGDRVTAWIRVASEDGNAVEAHATLLYDEEARAHVVELWEKLEPPPANRHDFSIIELMGHEGMITRVREFDDLLADLGSLRLVALAFSEAGRTSPLGYPIGDPQWDNNYGSSHEEPRLAGPSHENTVVDRHYLLDFARGFFLDVADVAPVQYRNAMMNDGDPESRDGNVIEMRWLLQRELGGSVVFFHHVTIPPGAVEGTHRHVGSEELYYIVEGEGTAYMGAGDDRAAGSVATVERHIHGSGLRACTELPVRAGSVIFTKDGGIHGIRNTSADRPLRFVAFLYHSE